MTADRRDNSRIEPAEQERAGTFSVASYRALAKDGELRRRSASALTLLRRGEFCPGGCGGQPNHPNRQPCRSDVLAILHSCGPLTSGEPCLRGSRGSAAFHSSGCSLRCADCQSWRTGWAGGATGIRPDDFAALMLQMQAMGCHNIDLVNPGHDVVPFLEALLVAVERGLHIPIIYTSCGYDRLEVLRLLDGIVDIYAVTLKYSDPEHARAYTDAHDYVEVSREATREMHRQVGDLVVDERGLARRGLIVRHVVLPNGIAGADGTFRFVARNISPGTAINVRHDYEPWSRTRQHPAIGRRPYRHEIADAIRSAAHHGLHRFDRGSHAHRFLDRP